MKTDIAKLKAECETAVVSLVADEKEISSEKEQTPETRRQAALLGHTISGLRGCLLNLAGLTPSAPKAEAKAKEAPAAK